MIGLATSHCPARCTPKCLPRTRHRVLRLELCMRNPFVRPALSISRDKGGVLFRGNVRVRRRRPVSGDRGAGTASGSGP
jgi:hypothetical protein